LTVADQTQRIKRKLSLLQLADELGNVARACKLWASTATTSTRCATPSSPAACPPWSKASATPVRRTLARQRVRRAPVAQREVL